MAKKKVKNSSTREMDLHPGSSSRPGRIGLSAEKTDKTKDKNKTVTKSKVR